MGSSTLPPLKVPEGPGGISGGFVRVGIAYPWLWLGSIYSVWLIATATLNRPPRAMLDDPKHIGGWVDAAYTSSIILLFLAVPILIASIGAVLWRGFLKRASWRNVLLWLAALQASWILAWALARLDPGQIVSWYLD